MMSLTFGLFTQVRGSGPLGPLVALRTAKTLWSFGHSECNRARGKMTDWSHWTDGLLCLSVTY